MALYNPDKLTDGFYGNAAVDKSGNRRLLSVGMFNFKPDQVRFVKLREAVRAGNGFRMSVRNGNLVGPFKTKAEAEEAVKSKVGSKKVSVEVPTLRTVMDAGYKEHVAHGIVAEQQALADGKSENEAGKAARDAVDAWERANPDKIAAEKAEADAKVAKKQADADAKATEDKSAAEQEAADKAAAEADTKPAADNPDNDLFGDDDPTDPGQPSKKKSGRKKKSSSRK